MIMHSSLKNKEVKITLKKHIKYLSIPIYLYFVIFKPSFKIIMSLCYKQEVKKV